MADFDAIKALQTAQEAEKKGLITYLNFAYQTKDTTGKNMFILLSMDEFNHLQILETQQKSIQEKECWLSIDIESSLIEKIVPELDKKELKVKGEKGLDQVSALKTALELENRAIQFYEVQAKNATEPRAKEMYQRLTEMERAHYDLVRAEIDYIEKTGFWFDIREFSLELA